MGNRKHNQETPPNKNTKAVENATDELKSRVADVNRDRLGKFTEMDDSDMNEGTAEYFKFANPGEKVDVLFLGTSLRNLDSNNPDKQSECADCERADGSKVIFAQTIIVKELKKRWDKSKELGFPARIIFQGEHGTGSDKYQKFRILFED